MKHKFFFILVILLTTSLSMFAQKVTINLQNAKLGDVFTTITQQTGLKVAYSRPTVNPDKIISISVSNEELTNILDKLFKDGNISYKIEEKTVFLKEKGDTIFSSKQAFQIKGNILDTKGESIIGASILEKGTTNGTITDIDGNFSLDVSSRQSILIISYIGYKTQEIAANKAYLQITLHEDSEALEEVVVIGYGTQSRAKITGSIAKLEGSKLVGNLAVTSFDQALASKLPGVNIQQATGAPGAGVNIKIRGTSSINFSGHPLIVVDGLPLSNSSFDETLQGKSTISGFQSSYAIDPLSSINPSDIASIDVLKDAASTAIYGSRGSNGVIMITTKKGKEGKPAVNFNMYVGAQKLSKKVDVMDAYQLARYTKLSRDEAWVAIGGNANDPLDIRTSANTIYPDYMLPYLEGKPGLTNTDWQDEIYRTAMQQNYDISVAGGTEKINYYISGNYMNQEGIIINSGIKRYSVRSNLNMNITDKLRLGMRLNANQTDNNLVQSEGAWNKEGIVITALMYHPNLPAYNKDGSIAKNLMLDELKNGQNIAKLQNPIALAKMETNKLQNRTFIGNADLEYTILEGLKIKTAFGVESMGLHRTFYRPKSLSHSNEVAPTKSYNYGLDSRSSIFNWISETSITYNADFGNHNLNVLGNFSAQKETVSQSMVEGQNFPNDNVTTINAAATSTGTSFSQEAAMASFLGRVMYSYESKYMLSVSLRYDGSSRFAANSKWGWFPSLSGGWNISQETFYPKKAWVNNLKLRASYGITGNAEIPYYGGVPVLAANNYIFGNSGSKDIALGFSPENAPNKDLSWESTSNCKYRSGCWIME